uniref:Pyroglutamyl-peptidase I n=1 Tax=Cyprinodon variegatus TaxID=28743 RepID=A0A3Q2DAE5_CYPVA
SNTETTQILTWKAGVELERLGLGEAAELHVCELPVDYLAVQSILPSLWKQHQPQLAVHVGVSGLATSVTLEQFGHNKGYERLDNRSFCPASHCCMENGADSIKSVIDMHTVCKKVNESNIGVTVSVSEDAGRYLCDYTYYTSLHQGRGRSAFVHVPPLGGPYSKTELGRGLQAVVKEMLNWLEADYTEEEQKDKKLCHHQL